jgi:hypothetical protein
MPAVIRRIGLTGPRIGVQPIAEFDHLRAPGPVMGHNGQWMEDASAVAGIIAAAAWPSMRRGSRRSDLGDCVHRLP